MSNRDEATHADQAPHPSFMFAMGELSGQVAALREELAIQRQERHKEADDINLRLDALERWRYITVGVAVTVTTTLNLVVTLWIHYHG